MKKFSLFKKLFISSIFFLGLQSANAGIGTLLVANLGSDSVSIFDQETLRKIWDIKVGFKPHEVEISPDGEFALVSNFGTLDGLIPGFTLTMIKMSDGSVAQTINLINKCRPHGIEFISNTTALISAQGIQSLIVEDFLHAPIQKIIPLPGRGAHYVRADMDKRFAYVANTDSGTVVKVDLQSDTVVGELPIGQAAEGEAITPDNQLLLVTDRKDNFVGVVRLKDFTLIKKIPTDKGPIRIAMFDYGKSAVVTNSAGGTAQIIDIATLAVTKTFKTTNSRSEKYGNVMGSLVPVPDGIAVRTDQKTAFITNMYAGNVTKVDLEQGTILETFEAAVEPDGVAMSDKY